MSVSFSASVSVSVCQCPPVSISLPSSLPPFPSLPSLPPLALPRQFQVIPLARSFERPLRAVEQHVGVRERLDRRRVKARKLQSIRHVPSCSASGRTSPPARGPPASGLPATSRVGREQGSHGRPRLPRVPVPGPRPGSQCHRFSTTQMCHVPYRFRASRPAAEAVASHLPAAAALPGGEYRIRPRPSRAMGCARGASRLFASAARAVIAESSAPGRTIDRKADSDQAPFLSATTPSPQKWPQRGAASCLGQRRRRVHFTASAVE